MIDCTGGAWKNTGCRGGYMTNCFNYLKSNKIMKWDDYPYVTNVGSCKYDASKGVVGVSSYTSLPKNDPQALLNAVNK